MPTAALATFKEDIARATALVSHGDVLPHATIAQATLRSDILRSSWMLSVGAVDAYFCDAFSDFFAATMISKQRHPAMILPRFFNDMKVPVRAVLAGYAIRINWKWRMAARAMMEKANMLDVSAIHDQFNRFFRPGHKLWNDVADSWIGNCGAGDRLFGITANAYAALAANAKDAQRKTSIAHFERRMKHIIQRRHDCIHTCDRPKNVPQVLDRAGTVRNVIRDVSYVVSKFDTHAAVEFREFLLGNGLPNNLVTLIGY